MAARTTCPQCKHTHLKHGYSIWRMVLGLLFIIVGLLLVLPTLGITAPLIILGIFMMSKRTWCAECEWSTRYRP